MLDSRLESCPACGRELSPRYADRCACGLELPTPGRGESQGELGVFAATELDPPALEPLAVEEAARDTLSGGWMPGETWVVHGPGGSGKSRLVLRWASVAPCLVVALEMSPELTAHTASSAGGRLSNLNITAERDWSRHIGRRRLLVVDSITETGDPDGAAREASAWARRTGGIAWLISQETTAGEPRGGPTVVHDVGAQMRVTSQPDRRSARVEIRKRRLAPPGPPCVLALGPLRKVASHRGPAGRGR